MATDRENDEEDDIIIPSVANTAAKNDDLLLSSKENHRRETKRSISDTAKLLSSRKDVELDRDDISLGDDDDDDSIVLEDDEALAELHFAATRRRNLDRKRVREARIVEPVYGKEDIHLVPVPEEISQKDMMWRMMRALSKAEKGEAGAGRAALEKKIRRLHANGKEALSVPLPAPVQGRLDRASAYEDTKHEVGEKWGRIVQKNRKAKQLVFPLNGPGKETGGNTASIVGNFKPEANYEEEIDSLLRDAGVSTDHDVLKQEDDGAGGFDGTTVTKEEVLKRRRELAKIRSLMFHYEHKMKRIKRIKSKKYRRVMKKEKEKLSQTMGESGDDESKIRRAEQRRVEERMTLRHKNTSKWVRRQLQRKEGNRNPSTKAAIEEQLRMHEELRRRQESEIKNSETSDEESARGEASDEEDIDGEEESLRKELSKSDQRVNSKGIMGLRFMKQAQEKKRKEALALLEQMNQGDGDEQTDETPQTLGRQSFQGQQSKVTLSSEAIDATDAPNEVRERVSNTPANLNCKPPCSSPAPDGGDDAHGTDTNTDEKTTTGFGFTTKLNGKLSADVNPWLTGFGQSEDQNNVSKNHDSNTATENEREEGITNLPPRPTTTSLKTSSPRLQSTGPTDQKEETVIRGASSRKRQRSKRKEARTQNSTQEEAPKLTQPDDELMRMQDISQAFAGVGGAEQADFHAAKQSEVERNMPTAQSLQAEVLPGWGAWDGAGMPKRRRTETPFAKAARERLEAARAIAANKRSDRTMQHVILNEKRVKQATDLTLSSVPFPFTSREQWQREVDTSVCREMVSSAAYKEAIRKRVVAKPGTAIEPIRQSESYDKNARRGKHGVIALRKERSEKRTKARRGLMT